MIDLGPELLDWIDRLYQIDAEWRVREERSLTWWPFVFRQQIVADIPQESFGEDVTRLTATTPLLTNVPDDDVTYKLLLGMNYLATFSAIIYEPERTRRADPDRRLLLSRQPRLAWTVLRQRRDPPGCRAPWHGP